MNNKFIVFEGADHSGKGTQIELLKDYCRGYNKDVFFTREPGGRQLLTCEKIRELLLDCENAISPITEAYLYAASRAEHVVYIKQQLKERTVVCDRYVQSSIIYQGIARGLGQDKVAELNEHAVDGIHADLIFYLKLDKENYLLRRKKNKTLDRIEKEPVAFFDKILDGYDKVMATYDNVITIDASLPIKEIHNIIIKTLIDKEYL